MTYSINIAQEGQGSGPSGFETLGDAIDAAQPWVDGGDWPGATGDEEIHVLVWNDEDGTLEQTVVCTIPAALA